MHRTPPTRLLLALSGLVILTLLAGGCGRGGRAQPTATPTKTPFVEVVVPDTPTPTNTPTRVPPTATPTPMPPTDTPTPIPPTDTPTPELVARAPNENPLTGLVVSDPTVLERRPLFVVINNDPPARELHYGFAEADMVYEYIMEGRAVTRFAAVYLAGEAERIGPLRSARLINWYLTPQYGGALVASGAGGDVNWWLTFKMDAPYLSIDLNDPTNTLYSWNVGSHWMTRMQTSTRLLRNWLADWDVEEAADLRGFTFAESAPPGQPGERVTIAYPAEVTWEYDALSGVYLRTMDGVPHLDAASGEQLSASNVIIQTMPHEATDYVEDSLGTTSIRIISVGEGPVTVLRDGGSYDGIWRADEASTPQWLDEAGNPLPLKPGNSWVEVVEPNVFFAVE